MSAKTLAAGLSILAVSLMVALLAYLQSELESERQQLEKTRKEGA
jgi:hypothetical protein